LATPINMGLSVMTRLILSVSAAAFVAIAASSFFTTPGRAEIDYPWCSSSSTGQGGGPSCRYTSLEQCQAAVFGLNGWCSKNSRIVWQEQQQQAPKRGSR
jgi:hypothetical protein